MVSRCLLVGDWVSDVLCSVCCSDHAVPLLRQCLYLKHEELRPAASCRCPHLSSQYHPVCDPLNHSLPPHPHRCLFLRRGPPQIIQPEAAALLANQRLSFQCSGVFFT